MCHGAYSCYVQVVAENGLLEARQQFEAHLSELRSKAELLSSHLEKEAGQRKSTEEEVRGEGDGEIEEGGLFWSTVCVPRYLHCVIAWRMSVPSYRRRCEVVQKNSCSRER